jgi:hypothetical protein
LVTQDHKVLKERLDLLVVKESKAHKDHKDQLVTQDHKVLKERLDLLVLKDYVVLKALRELQAHKDL